MYKRFVINVAGIVQGVGFRPYIFRLANRLNLSGYVNNNSDGVRIEIEGKENNLSQFLSILETQPPPLAQITKLDIHEIDHLDGILYTDRIGGDGKLYKIEDASSETGL